MKVVEPCLESLDSLRRLWGGCQDKWGSGNPIITKQMIVNIEEKKCNPNENEKKEFPGKRDLMSQKIVVFVK